MTADCRIEMNPKIGILNIAVMYLTVVSDQGVHPSGTRGVISIGLKLVITSTMDKSSKSVTG